MTRPLWVYGIAEGAAAAGAGLDAAPVTPLAEGGLVALVSEAPPQPVAPTRRHMLAHTAVLERAMAEADVLPVRFGTIAPHAEALARCLARNAAALRAALSGIAGRVELGLRVSWKDGVVFREILDADPGLRALRDRLQSRPGAETYEARIELGRRVEAAVASRRAAEAAALLAPLLPLAERAAELKAVEDSMVLSRAFLVPRAREAEFDAAVAALAAREEARLSVKYVGPVPPFNFVALRAEWFEGV